MVYSRKGDKGGLMEGQSLGGRILGGLWGSIVGDALGVPVEFSDRKERKKDPVTDMRGYGTHGQPPGTWSDDSSLTFCTVQSLTEGFYTNDMGKSFVAWYKEGRWTPWGKVFDIGGTTQSAINRIARGVVAEVAGDSDEGSNGNGSLMRILPVGLRFAGVPSTRLLDYAHRVSSMTHRHPRSQMACGFYCLIAAALLRGLTPFDAYAEAVQTALIAYREPPFSAELPHFGRLLSSKVHELRESSVRSDGYVVHTLEAAIWCLLNSASFSEAVLKAVNLGGDTDTTGCVTGGLAGIHYGLSAIPEEWINGLARREEIQSLLDGFVSRFSE
jgi:ADP-ribosylglycohydrolase